MESSEKIQVFDWTEQRCTAALSLGEGKTRKEAAADAEVTERTIYDWLRIPAFAEEVDRLTLMTGIATRAERLRIAKRAVLQKTKGVTIRTNKDLLDWLKFAQSETDGIKLDLAQLAAALGEDAP